jgi:uncharacterized membrane protein YqiK
VRVNKTKEDVLRVAQAIGCQRASHQKTLEELFAAKFSEALKTVGKRLEFEQLYSQRDDFKDQIPAPATPQTRARQGFCPRFLAPIPRTSPRQMGMVN